MAHKQETRPERARHETDEAKRTQAGGKRWPGRIGGGHQRHRNRQQWAGETHRVSGRDKTLLPRPCRERVAQNAMAPWIQNGHVRDMSLTLRPATAGDTPLILSFIRGLAEYEKLLPQVEATEERLRATLFPPAGHPAAECLLAFEDDDPAGFAIFFTNY